MIHEKYIQEIKYHIFLRRFLGLASLGKVTPKREFAVLFQKKF